MVAGMKGLLSGGRLAVPSSALLCLLNGINSGHLLVFTHVKVSQLWWPCHSSVHLLHTTFRPACW